MTSASAEVDELSKELVKHTAAWTHKKDAVKAEKKNVEKFQKQAQKHEEATAKETERLDQLAAEADARRRRSRMPRRRRRRPRSSSRAYSRAVAREATATSPSRRSSPRLTPQSPTPPPRLKTRLSPRSTAKRSSSAPKKLFAAKEKEGAKLAKDLASAEETHANAKAALEAAGGGDSSNLDALEAECETKRKILDKAQEKVDVLNGHLAGLDFKFKDPEAKFDRSRVKGVVAKLMQVKDPAMSTALEVVAGGKLYQVVVDTEVTGKALLSKGQLQKRVTIIRANKIDARTCSTPSARPPRGLSRRRQAGAVPRHLRRRG